ncbi:MAG: hypothetical protein PHO02_01210 [Candidatus Nanoarchaeia archaeon]|nr:hypothetical protein [Candidatus Nanoarchaeia archaeon]
MKDNPHLLKNRDEFFNLIKKCNGTFREISPSLYLYKKIVEMHNCSKNINELLQDNEFFELIYITLKAWNMNQRKAKLAPFNEFKKSIQDNESTINELYPYRLESLSQTELESVLNKLKLLFYNLNVMKSKTKIVGVSKTLHFLLPHLVIPMDRKYTMDFFYGHNAYSQNIDKEFQIFKEIFNKSYEIAKQLKLSNKDIDNFNWNTSVPKLIDNAIIGMKSK